MEAKCYINLCQSKPSESVSCNGFSLAVCNYHKNLHLKNCQSVHSISSLYIKLSNDKSNQFATFLKNELAFIETQLETFLRRMRNVFQKINKFSSKALIIMNSQKKFFIKLLKNIEQYNILPICFFEENMRNKPIEVDNLETLLRNNFKSQYNHTDTKYQEFVFELTDRPIFNEILQHYEKPTKARSFYNGSSQKNNVESKNYSAEMGVSNYVQPYEEYGNYKAEMGVSNYVQPYEEYENSDVVYNVICAGDSESEKYTLLNFFRRDNETSANIGANIFTITTTLDSGLKVKLNIRDNAGEEIYKESNSSFFDNTHGVVLVYSTANEATYNSISIWLSEFKNNCEKHCKFILIGIKSELCTKIPELIKVPSFVGENFARINNLLFAELSYQDRHNCLMAFKMLSEEIYKSEQQKKIEAQNKPNEKKRKWYKKIIRF
ncbi:hypothetical protein SteCoe_24403 [Stentor coeruleus]|uniref:Uncharacterized protein n=1 Tax=Stentor coeruleus TaxID=5963 RepID=A0A1R2BHN1_9CILI|nr:hypothetical protein SteCoe_24403 [Stentor coeruleus]